MENNKVIKTQVKESWVKPEVKELDINETAGNFNGGGSDGSFFS